MGLKALLTLIVMANISYAIDLDVKFKGDVNYTKQGDKEKLTHRFGPEYRLNLYEPIHKKWIFFLGGKITFDYNHFGGELKSNVFTVLGIEY